jgi:hypothetical protein
MNNATIMNNKTEGNDSRTESVACTPTKRSWQSPEIEEVDLAETQGATGLKSDGLGHS